MIPTFPSGPLGTNAYLLICPKTQHAAIIDPSPGSAKAITQFCTDYNLVPEKILLTHSHWDHIADVATLKKKYKIPVLIHPLDAPNLEQPGSDKLPCWINFEGVLPDALLNEGDTFAVGSIKVFVIHTPGHSPGGVCFYCPEQKLLISGDTLFKGTIGTLSLPTAQPKLMWDSLKKLAKLPRDTMVYPGHGESTTIGNENWLSKSEELFG
jgi:hydroxyacylglutathione hydrolase